jgi:hypothetical protein
LSVYGFSVRLPEITPVAILYTQLFTQLSKSVFFYGPDFRLQCPMERCFY